MITKSVKLYLGDGFPVRIPVSQFDTMWQFVFEIIHNSQPWQIPTGATAVLNGRKPDGNVFAFSGTIANNTVTVDADVQMTACAGNTICELSILDDGKTVGTANFTLAVESAPNSTGETPSASDVDAYGAIVSGELDTYFEQHPEMIEGKGLSEPIRLAILNCFRRVAWVDEHGSDYYNTLYNLLMNKEILSITAVFEQGSAVIYDTDSLDTLRQYLVVTASYDDGTTGEVAAYELSGTLTEGTSTITVSYGGKTTTFSVIVTHAALYTLQESDFSRKVGNTGKSRGGAYSETIITRISYIKFDILFEGGKTYRFLATSTYDTAQIGVQFFNQNALTAVAGGQDIPAGNIDDSSGWSALDFTCAVPSTINGSPTAGARFTFRQSTNNPTIADDFSITQLTIDEVTT